MIINPVNGDIHDISSLEGKSILKKYIQNYNNGGSFEESDDELVANLFKEEPEPVKETWERDAASITPPPPPYVEKRDRLRRFLNGIYRMFLNRWNRYLGKTEDEKQATMELWQTPDTPENRKKVGEHIAYLTFKREIDDTAVSEMIGGMKRSRAEFENTYFTPIPPSPPSPPFDLPTELPTNLDIIEKQIEALKGEITRLNDSVEKSWTNSITPPPKKYITENRLRQDIGTDFSWHGEDPIDKYNKMKEVYINRAEHFFTRGLNDGNLLILLDNATFTSMEELKELFDFTDEDLKRGKIDEELKIRLGEILALHYFDVEYLSNKGRSLSPTQATEPLMSEDELIQLGGMFGKFPPLPPVSMDNTEMLEDIARSSPTPFTAITSPISDLRDTARVIMNASPVLTPISDVPKANLSKTDLDALKLLDDLKDFLNRKRVEKRKRDEGTVSSSIIKPVSTKGDTLSKPTVRRSKRTRRSKRIFEV